MCDFPLSSLNYCDVWQNKGSPALKAQHCSLLKSTSVGFTVQKHKPKQAVDGQSASLVRTRQIVIMVTDGCIWLEEKTFPFTSGDVKQKE